MKPIELLMPAGDFEKMRFAFAYGADAVYLGIPQYSLRARENGFNRESVPEAVEYAHSLGKKIYVTANIIPHNHKARSFVAYVEKLLKECQPDAWIMSDPGLIMLMRENFPEQEIHLSVQANTVNYASAQFWQQLGVGRLILSRELTLSEITEIHKACPDIEIEAFVHGAICIAYSGRCLISNYMSYRDPNQGTCSHSCRWEYKVYEKEELQPSQNSEKISQTGEEAQTQHGDSYRYLKGDYYLEETERPGEFMQLDEDENGTYLMNARDLCAIEHLADMRKAGVCSFKVEGRSKSIYYAALVARAYRRALDDLQAGRELDPNNMIDIFATSNRGFIAGFLKGNPGWSAQKFDTGRAESPYYQYAGVVRGYDEEKKLLKVQPKNKIEIGAELELCTPEEDMNLKVEQMFNEAMHPIESIHAGPQKCFWVPFDRNPGEFAVLRERLTEEAVSGQPSTNKL